MLLSRLVSAPRALPVGCVTPLGNGLVSVTGLVRLCDRIVFAVYPTWP
jgi:hypothetical protein